MATIDDVEDFVNANFSPKTGYVILMFTLDQEDPAIPAQYLTNCHSSDARRALAVVLGDLEQRDQGNPRLD